MELPDIKATVVFEVRLNRHERMFWMWLILFILQASIMTWGHGKPSWVAYLTAGFLILMMIHNQTKLEDEELKS